MWLNVAFVCWFVPSFEALIRNSFLLLLTNDRVFFKLVRHCNSIIIVQRQTATTLIGSLLVNGISDHILLLRSPPELVDSAQVYFATNVRHVLRCPSIPSLHQHKRQLVSTGQMFRRRRRRRFHLFTYLVQGQSS